MFPIIFCLIKEYKVNTVKASVGSKAETIFTTDENVVFKSLIV